MLQILPAVTIGRDCASAIEAIVLQLFLHIPFKRLHVIISFVCIFRDVNNFNA